MIGTHQAVSQLQIMQQEFLNKMAEFDVLLSQAGLNRAQISKCFSDIGVNNAMIEQIHANVRNLDADTLIKGSQLTEQNIRNEMLGVKNYMMQDALRIFKETGVDLTSPTNISYLRLAAQGKTDDAKKLLGNLYDFSRGQYGARSAQVQQWINTAVGGIATIGGLAMMFVPGLQVPGGLVTAYGASKVTKVYQGHPMNLSSYKADPYGIPDYSHVPE